MYLPHLCNELHRGTALKCYRPEVAHLQQLGPVVGKDVRGELFPVIGKHATAMLQLGRPVVGKHVRGKLHLF
eukprot:scaffold81158_cov20-Tisochrysis_lutea.AAC.3